MLVVVAGDLVIILIGTAVPSSHISATRIEDVQHPVSYVSMHIQTQFARAYILLDSNGILMQAVMNSDGYVVHVRMQVLQGI